MNRGTEPVSRELAALLSRCVVNREWAEQDEGPYHREAQAERRDIVEDRDGTSLQLGIRLAGDAGTPRRDAVVEVWQCDAFGRYSGFPPPGSSLVVTATTAPRVEHLSDQTFLRGRQSTDDAGMVEFRTIFPGWYPGRTVHIHLMVHDRGRQFASQLYFPENVNTQVLASAPYAARRDRDTTNHTDTVFCTGGEPAVVDITPHQDGYRAAICLILPNEREDLPRASRSS